MNFQQFTVHHNNNKMSTDIFRTFPKKPSSSPPPHTYSNIHALRFKKMEIYTHFRPYMMLREDML